MVSKKEKEKEKLRYKNPFYLIFGIIIFVTTLLIFFFWWLLGMSFILAFKFAQLFCVIKEDENIVRKQHNKWVDKLKMVIGK